MVSTYLTVAIPYVNAEPHLGYAYELVLADIAARARRSEPASLVRFLGGTDDYSLKNVLAAELAGVSTAEFVATHAARFAGLQEPLSITFDDFIQTSSDARHVPAVARLWRRVYERGDLYRKRYTGQYCVGCEQFYGPSELDNGCCPEHGTPIESVEEDNWFFRLSGYQEYLDRAISSGTLAVTPEAFRAEALAFVRAGLTDISVSRSARRARGWGIPVPNDPDQVIYVWFDALGSYISALGYGAPDSPAYKAWWAGAEDRVHVIGKGILRFHAVYWPAFLASAGEAIPTRVHVHPYLSLEGAKISKSSGVSLDPVEIANSYGVDALRWWFARDVHPVADTDFTIGRLIDRANEDLAGGFANLVNRISTLLVRHRSGVVPEVAIAPIPETVGLADAVIQAFADLDLRRGTQLLLDGVATVNRDLEATAPWALAKDPGRAQELDEVLVRQLNSTREIVAGLAPVLPGLSGRLAGRLTAEPGQPLLEDGPIYVRLERPK